MQKIISTALVFVYLILSGLIKPIEAFAVQNYTNNSVVSNSINKQKTVVKYLDDLEKYQTFIQVNQTKIFDNLKKTQNFNFGFGEDFIRLSENLKSNLYFKTFNYNNSLKNNKYRNIKYIVSPRAP